MIQRMMLNSFDVPPKTGILTTNKNLVTNIDHTNNVSEWIGMIDPFDPKIVTMKLTLPSNLDNPLIWSETIITSTDNEESPKHDESGG